MHLRYCRTQQAVKTHDQLKKKLYGDIIQLFDEGDVREMFLPVPGLSVWFLLGMGKGDRSLQGVTDPIRTVVRIR